MFRADFVCVGGRGRASERQDDGVLPGSELRGSSDPAGQPDGPRDLSPALRHAGCAHHKSILPVLPGGRGQGQTCALTPCVTHTHTHATGTRFK